MTTTFETFAGQRARNYSTLPTKDVEVVRVGYHCNTCGKPVYNAGVYSSPVWKHEDGTDEHYTRPRDTCMYCGTDEPGVVVFKQKSWSDETHCSRCGGVEGYAIGD